MDAFLVLALVHGAIAVLLYLASKHRNLVGHDRGFRNHLRHLYQAWYGVVLCYALTPAVLLPREWSPPSLGAADLTDELTAVADAILLYGALWVVIYLRRGILELETTRSRLYSPAHAHPFVGLSHVVERTLRRLSDDALLPAALGSQALLFLPTVLQVGGLPYFRIAAWLPIMVVNVALLLRLGLAYRFVLDARALWVIALAVACGQLLSPLLAVFADVSAVAIVTGALQAILGVAIVAAMTFHAWRLEKPQENTQPEDDFLRLAVRLATMRRLHETTVKFSAVLLLFFWYLATRFGFERLGDRLGANASPLAERGGFVVGAVLLAAGAQLILYLARFFSYHVKWEFQTAPGHGLRKYRAQGVPRPPGWRQLTITSRQPRPPVSGDDRVSRKQVILVHGLFSDCESTWGLLPAYLCDRPDVTAVHLLDYRHSLFTLGRNRLEQLTGELGGGIAFLADADPGARTVVIGHSLGGLLLLRAVARLADEQDHLGTGAGTVFSRLGHVGVVGAPLLGSVLSILMWPWPIWRELSLRSTFIRETLERFSDRVPRPGSIEGVLRGFPIVSFLFGRRDEVVHSVVRFFRFGSHMAQATAAHDLGWISERSDEALEEYRRMLEHSDGRVESMERIARLAAGGVQPAFSVVVRTSEAHDIASGVIVRDNQSGAAREASADPLISGRLLAEVLARLLIKDDLDGVALEQESQRVCSWLAAEYSYSGQWQQLRSVGLPTGHRAYLFSSGRVGLCAVFRETLKQPPDGASMPLIITTSMPLADLVAERVLSCDRGAVAAMFCEDCGHAHDMQVNAAIEGASIHAVAAIDSEGSYYAIYDLVGKVRPGARADHLAIHMGASGVASSSREMYFAAFDLVAAVPLEFEGPHSGRQCCLWRVMLRKQRSGEQVRVRWTYRRRHCMSREGDVDFINLGKQGTGVDSALLSLSVVGTVMRSEALLVSAAGIDTTDRQQTSSGSCSVMRVSWQRGTTPCEGIGLAYTVGRLSDERPELAPTVTLRAATAGDLAVLAAYDNDVAARVPAGADVWQQRRERFADGVVVAALDDMVVGYAAFLRANFGRERIDFDQVRAFTVHEDKGKTAFLLFCGVLPSFRRRGIGEALVRSVQERARALGCDEVQVVATPESRDFFMRLGFRVFREDSEFIEGLAGIRMGNSLVALRP